MDKDDPSKKKPDGSNSENPDKKKGSAEVKNPDKKKGSAEVKNPDKKKGSAEVKAENSPHETPYSPEVVAEILAVQQPDKHANPDVQNETMPLLNSTQSTTNSLGEWQISPNISLKHSISSMTLQILSEYLPKTRSSSPTPAESLAEALVAQVEGQDPKDEEIVPVENPSNSPEKPKPPIKYLGIYFALVCSFFMSLSTFIVYILVKKRKYTGAYCLLWRFIGVSTGGILQYCYFAIKKNYEPIFSGLWPLSVPIKRLMFILLMLRAIVGSTSLVLQFFSLSHIELGDSAVIIYSNPVFVALFAHFLIKEPCGFVPTIMALVTITGVVIIARPPFITGVSYDPDHMMGIGLALGAMITNVFVFIILRFLKGVHYVAITIVFGLVGLLLGSILSAAYEEFNDPVKEPSDVYYFVALGFASWLAQVALTLSLKYEEAGLVSLIRTLDVVFSYLWQMSIGHLPDMWSIIGSIIVTTCVVVMGFRKVISEQKPENKIRRTCRFLLK